jgi:hypothetical protein
MATCGILFCSFILLLFTVVTPGIAQSVWRLVTGLTVRGSNPVGDGIFRTRPDRSLSPPNPLYNGYRVFPDGKEAGAWL